VNAQRAQGYARVSLVANLGGRIIGQSEMEVLSVMDCQSNLLQASLASVIP
jgi:hypothetical protein